jgi:hypothetical protein
MKINVSNDIGVQLIVELAKFLYPDVKKTGDSKTPEQTMMEAVDIAERVLFRE